jgi:hypothetical protein
MVIIELIGLFLLVTVFNAGVVAFAATTIAFKSMRWFLRVAIAFVGSVIAFPSIRVFLGWAFQVVSKDAVFATVVLCNVVALFPMAIAIAWLRRRNARGIKSGMKWAALSFVVLSFALTCLAIPFAIRAMVR